MSGAPRLTYRASAAWLRNLHLLESYVRYLPQTAGSQPILSHADLSRALGFFPNGADCEPRRTTIVAVDRYCVRLIGHHVYLPLSA